MKIYISGKINSPYLFIQEDVFRYKAICKIVEETE